MIRFNTLLILKNKVLWAWPVLIFATVAGLFIWGDIQAVPNSHSFFISVGSANLPASLFMMQIISLIVLICIIGLPDHFAKNIKRDRASLILSRAVSRREFLLSDFAAVLLVCLLYTFITVIAFAVLIIAKTGAIPVAFSISLFVFIPLYMLAYYVSITLFLIITNSYLGAVILGYFLTGFSSILLHAKQLLVPLGYTSDFIHFLVDILSYIIPSAGGVQVLMTLAFQGGFSALDGSLFVFTLVSFVPFFVLSYYLFTRNQF